eukprot:scaffold4_cov396-Prasinococcus_capsulatus_cf.AAC.27
MKRCGSVLGYAAGESDRIFTTHGDVSSVNREVEIFDVSSGKKFSGLSNPECLTAVPSRNTAHPLLPIVAAGTNSGRVHIFK